MWYENLDTYSPFISVAKHLSEEDDISLSAQHMRLAETWLPGLVWWSISIEGL